MALGRISFSLYLIHVPIASRVTNGLLRLDTPLWISAMAAVGASLAAAMVFFELVEKRFLPSHSRSTAAVPAGEPAAAGR